VATGVIFQIIDYKFERNVLPPSCTGCSPIRLQNTLVNVTPYFNYAVASQWQIATQIALDWDQRGHDKGTLDFNNNLDHRYRVALNRFLNTYPFAHVGVNVQGLLYPMGLQYSALGMDFSMRF
jgi:hypothetical protein